MKDFIKRLTEINEKAKDFKNVSDAHENLINVTNENFDKSNDLLDMVIKNYKSCKHLQIVNIIFALLTLIFAGLYLFIKQNYFIPITCVSLFICSIANFLANKKKINGDSLHYEEQLLMAKTREESLFFHLLSAERKIYIINKVYNDAYKIMQTLDKNKAVHNQINKIKEEKGIDFEYLATEIKALEKLEKLKWEKEEE